MMPVFLLFWVLFLNGSRAMLMPRKAAAAPKPMIDLRSDTLTRPSPAMRKAISEAVVGDDVFGEDPTVNKLEARTAAMFQKESALFFPSGTMANLASVMAVCGKRGSEVILGDKSHMYLFEQGNLASIAGVSPRIVTNRLDGTMSMEGLEAVVRADNIHFPVTEMLIVENTHNYCGGRVLPTGYVEAVSLLARKKNIHLHMDGSRIWNAATASGTPLSKLADPVQSMTMSLSKGLGAPAGSMLVGPADLIRRARRVRKALGGGLRQVGVLAAAGLVALDDFEAGLLEADHARAKLLADQLSVVPGLRVDAATVDSNIVIVHLEYEGVEPVSFAGQLKERGVLVLPFGPRSMRIVLHRDVDDDDINAAIFAFREVAAKAWVISGAADAALANMNISQPEVSVSTPAGAAVAVSGAAHAPATAPSGVVTPGAAAVPTTLPVAAIAPSGPKTAAVGAVAAPLPVPSAVDIVDVEQFIAQAADPNRPHYEEVLVRGMTLSEQGFCVILWGTISERCVKVLVTPEDPMAEGLDRERVETSEAVTLLQLFQGIDVQAYLPRDALQTIFAESRLRDRDRGDGAGKADGGGRGGGGSSKHKYKLKLLQIESAGEKSGFNATLIARRRHDRDQKDATPPGTALTHTVQLLGESDSEPPAGLEAPQKPIINNRPGLSLPWRQVPQQQQQQSADTNAAADGSSSPALVDTRRRVQCDNAFMAIALALRHQATLEVRAELLHDDDLSYRSDELRRYFPRLIEADVPLPTLDSSGGLELSKRLPRRLAEARRQGNDAKSELIMEMMRAYKVPIPSALAGPGGDNPAPATVPAPGRPVVAEAQQLIPTYANEQQQSVGEVARDGSSAIVDGNAEDSQATMHVDRTSSGGGEAKALAMSPVMWMAPSAPGSASGSIPGSALGSRFRQASIGVADNPSSPLEL